MLSVVVCQGAFAAPAEKKASKWIVNFQPSRIVTGSPLFIQVTSPSALQSLSGTLLDHDIQFTATDGGVWNAFGGISLETTPGKHFLDLQGTGTDGKRQEFRCSVVVVKGKYRTIPVKVAKDYTEPSADQLQRISQEQKLKHEVFSQGDAKREWSGGFQAPVKAQISDTFGTKRVFNGKLQSVHMGLDYAVPEGTPVHALNRGTVLLAKPLFFEGNCVILDHGQGLLTIYMHLSKLAVKEDEKVETGQELGLSGGTGRATGPHLHVAVRWQGMYLDPSILLTLKAPESSRRGPIAQ